MAEIKKNITSDSINQIKSNIDKKLLELFLVIFNEKLLQQVDKEVSFIREEENQYEIFLSFLEGKSLPLKIFVGKKTCEKLEFYFELGVFFKKYIPIDNTGDSLPINGSEIDSSKAFIRQFLKSTVKELEWISQSNNEVIKIELDFLVYNPLDKREFAFTETVKKVKKSFFWQTKNRKLRTTYVPWIK